jgi:hypothetical protein
MRSTAALAISSLLPALLAFTTACGASRVVVDDGIATDVASPRGVRIATPQTGADASVLLARALSAVEGNRHAEAGALLDAVLRSDHLTDRGRANLYWLAADAHHRSGDTAAATDALGGFLVAFQVLPSDAELERRAVHARATLVTQKMERDPALGRGAENPIPVEDLRDPTTVMARLGCGPSGDARYVDETVEQVRSVDDRKLLSRRAVCSSDGKILRLWFDVTATSRAMKPGR